jgi:hypothetical protein
MTAWHLKMAHENSVESAEAKAPSTKEWALMARALFALFCARADTAALVDADYARALATNSQLGAASLETQEQHRQKCGSNIALRLRLLRRNFIGSLVILLAALIPAQLLSQRAPPFSPSVKLWFGLSSLFCFGWATLARLGWAAQSWKGDSIIERLDERIFKVFFWLGTFLGVLALA